MRNREDKNATIEKLVNELNTYNHIYITDISDLNAENTSKLRRLCFEKDVRLVVVKNKLLQKAIEKSDREIDLSIFNALKGHSSIMMSNVNSAPGKLIKEFRMSSDKPILKAAYVEESLYFGDKELNALASIKSKEELIGDIVGLLQSPMKNVVSALKSGGNIIAGVVKTLSERE